MAGPAEAHGSLAQRPQPRVCRGSVTDPNRRSHMVRFARWDEFDLESGRWSLPDERMKTRQAFAIPLAPEVVSLLKGLPKINTRSPYVFPGHGQSGVMHANGIRNLLHTLGYEHITRHGFRSTFRDWAGEKTPFPREICELALAHDERGETESAYSRSDFFDKRRELMNAWAIYATSTPEVADEAQRESSGE